MTLVILCFLANSFTNETIKHYVLSSKKVFVRFVWFKKYILSLNNIRRLVLIFAEVITSETFSDCIRKILHAFSKFTFLTISSNITTLFECNEFEYSNCMTLVILSCWCGLSPDWTKCDIDEKTSFCLNSCKKKIIQFAKQIPL